MSNYCKECYKKQEQIEQLKAENEQLKKELRVAQMNRMTMFEKLDIVNEKDTYKQALQEIRDIAGSEYIKPLSDKDCIECDRKFNEILAKINEVIGAE